MPGKFTSNLIAGWGDRTVTSLVGFGEARLRALDAARGVRAPHARRGRRDRQPQAAPDRPALVKAQDDAGGEGVSGAGRAAYLVAVQPDGALPPGPAARGRRDAARREVHHRER